jgi:hypothetical protein
MVGDSNLDYGPVPELTNTITIGPYPVYQLVATPNPYTLSNTTIYLGQISIANTTISNATGIVTSYLANWTWIPPAGSELSIGNTILAELPTSTNALTLTINAVSANTLQLTYNGMVYNITATGINTIYGAWTFNAFVNDSNGDRSPISQLSNTIYVGYIAPPINKTYSYEKAIVINDTQVPQNQTDFPFLFTGTFHYLANVANGGKVYNPAGYDIAFSNDINGSEPLYWQIESYNSTTGAVNVWINTSVTTGTNTTIYLWYGNSIISNFQSNSSRVWNNNYVGVWHLNETASSIALDSTANHNNGYPFGNVTSSNGLIDGAQNFSGSGGGINIPASASLDNMPNGFTISSWDYVPAAYSAPKTFDIFSKTNGNTAAPYIASILNCGGQCYVELAEGNGYAQTGTAGYVLLNQWQYTTFVYNSTMNQLQVYINAGLQATAPGTTYGDSGTNAIIGNNNAFTAPYNGLIERSNCLILHFRQVGFRQNTITNTTHKSFSTYQQTSLTQLQTHLHYPIHQ